TNQQLGIANPFALVPALAWAVLFVAILFLAAAAQRWFGDRGLLAAAAVAGMADVDAITIRVGRSAPGVHLAAQAIVLAAYANTLVKTIIAIAVGRWRFGRYIAVVSTVALAAAVMLVRFWA